MAETVDDLNIDYEENGEVIRETLDKAVLTKGAWSTVAFLYRERPRGGGELGKQKVSIRRYRKSNGVYREQSKFNISSGKQARALMGVLDGWFPEEA